MHSSMTAGGTHYTQPYLKADHLNPATRWLPLCLSIHPSQALSVEKRALRQ